MMKKYFNIWLLAALLCGMSLTVTSCKDDDKDDETSSGSSEERQQNEQADKALKFWSVVGQLVSMDDFTEDYDNATFEPAIGSEGDDSQTRVVHVNTAAAAAERFANLVGESTEKINDQTDSYSWSDPDVGSLTYTKVSDGTAWAKVEVSIKQVPHLSQIIYRKPAQGDENGSVGKGGSAYYRFGDVISRKNADGQKEYWICVRPAFDPEGKGDSHWISVSPLPKANQKTYTSSHGIKYIMPTAICKKKEHMQNLAEMLFAIFNPEQWSRNVINYSGQGMKMFDDFQFKNLAYHNDIFWTNVQKGWTDLHITDSVFGLTKTELEKEIKDNGLYLLWNGYSWWWTSINELTLFQAHYFNTPGGMNANMQTADPYTEVVRTVVNASDAKRDILVDITHDVTLHKPWYKNEAFFEDSHPRFIVRYATDKQLSNTKKYPDNQAKIPGTENVYRYYGDIYSDKKLTEAPEKTSEEVYAFYAPNKGEGGTYMIGDVLADYQGGRWFCFNGSPRSQSYTFINDDVAWFISFDYNASNLVDPVSEDDVPEVSLRFMEFIEYVRTMKPPYELDLADNQLGLVGQHILDYAGVDLRKLFSHVDSIWTFKDEKQKSYNSKSTSTLFNMVFRANNATNNTPIARCIMDVTQAGTERNSAPAEFTNWRFLCYKNYEKYDPDRITLTESEKAVGMTKWQALWPVTDDKMMLEDVASQAMVDKYTKGDKWQKSPRTTAEASASIADYLWKDRDFATAKTSIFKEPVLCFKVIKVTDKGGKGKPNLESQMLDSQPGPLLRIVHLQNDRTLYRGASQSMYAAPYIQDSKNAFFLNGQLFRVKPIPGSEGF
ncbi:MAG: hypothetical protein IKZ48_04480 [Prevotella sp.]|nr:hypothetical protein [Prevotella sp.]